MLVTEAKLILEKAGYTVRTYMKPDPVMDVYETQKMEIVGMQTLTIKDGAVNKDEVMNLLDERGYSVEDGQFHPTDADIGIYD